MNIDIQSIIDLLEDIEVTTNEEYTRTAIAEVKEHVVALEMQIKARDLYNELEIIKGKLQMEDRLIIKQVQSFLRNVAEMGVLK